MHHPHNSQRARKPGGFWLTFDAEKHAALARARNQTRIVWFTIVYLSVVSGYFMWLLTYVALGKAQLPPAMVNWLAAATVGQFAGAPIVLYRALFRAGRDDADNKSVTEEGQPGE